MAMEVFGYPVAELRCTQGPDFDAVREKTAPVCGAVTTQPVELLQKARLTCQKGGCPQSAMACLRCERFVNFVPSADRSFVTIRCGALSTDPVEKIMTLADAVVTISPRTRALMADEFARSRGVRHLVVESRGSVVGVVCRCDFLAAQPDELVADYMARRVLVVEPQTTIGAAAALMAKFAVGCLPVLDGNRLCGLVTRGDLRRFGVDEDRLGGKLCTRCGSHSGVCTDPRRNDARDLCLDCHRAAA